MRRASLRAGPPDGDTLAFTGCLGRYSLIRVRENAESIAFYGGVQQELKEIKRRFGEALDNFGEVLRAQRNLEFFTTGYRYLIQVWHAVALFPQVARSSLPGRFAGNRKEKGPQPGAFVHGVDSRRGCRCPAMVLRWISVPRRSTCFPRRAWHRLGVPSDVGVTPVPPCRGPGEEAGASAGADPHE